MMIPLMFMTDRIFGRALQFDFSPPEPPAPPSPTIINQAPSPSPSETSAEAIQAQIDAIPKILDAQKKYGSQFQDINLESLKKYGPAFAEQAIDLQNKYGTKYAQAQKDQQAILNPETLKAEEAIQKYLDKGPESLTAEEQHQFQQDVRSAQSTRGLAESGFGAQEEFSKLTALRQQLKGQYLNTALSTAGRVPVTGGAQVAASPQAQQSQLVQNVTPAEIFGGQASRNQFGASIYGSAVDAYKGGLGYSSSIYGSNAGLAGDIIGGGLSGAGDIIAASSRILKKNIHQVESGLAAIEKIDAVEFDWINSGDHDGGMIAEQLREVLPQAVVEVNGINHIKPMLVIAHLIQAVKELSDKVKTLERGEVVYG